MTCSRCGRWSTSSTSRSTQAYQRFKQEFSNQPSFVQAVPADEIPDSFRVKLRNPATDYSIVAGTLQGRPGVDQIMDERSLLDKFYKLLNGLRNGSLIVALIMVIAAVLLVGNTIRLSAFNRRRETGIMRLVGASNFYVQLPFLLEAVIAGLFGWIIAVRVAPRSEDPVAGYVAAVLHLQCPAERR